MFDKSDLTWLRFNLLTVFSNYVGAHTLCFQVHFLEFQKRGVNLRSLLQLILLRLQQRCSVLHHRPRSLRVGRDPLGGNARGPLALGLVFSPLPEPPVVRTERDQPGEPGADEESDKVKHRLDRDDRREDFLHLDARKSDVGQGVMAENGGWRGAEARELVVSLLGDVHELQEPGWGLGSVEGELCARRDGDKEEVEVEGVQAKGQQAGDEGHHRKKDCNHLKIN